MIQRKQNRLRSFCYSQNGAYFITMCTQNRNPILSIITDNNPKPILTKNGKIAENLILSVSERYPMIYVDQYSVMPDHIHLLIRIENGTGNPSPTVGEIVSWFKYTATKQINRMNGTVGERQFQRSYYDHIIRNEEDYDSCWMYIENNPTSWKIKHQNQST